ncbi:DegT/DnrJ/EryC1/StrS family aminotransferase [Natrinema salinisoli]|uniref:DegT/DnrJ/EryC1/StrS family aminotransferase n=1 Tax=Natrinema salinisoli TaxID=2878535 RepID=UPI001CF095A7|nr:DegT/DnrJ/EryC1/StrS family aminotransferase [Natrinema salinisoli]
MTGTGPVKQAEKEVLSYLGGYGHTRLFWKGRVAFYAILEALDIGDGDEVIVPGFTCVAVPNAILYRGAIPVYVDVNPDTYTITADAIEDALTGETAAVLAQNSFGLAPDLDAIADVLPKDIPLIEDCAHGLGGEYRGQPNGTVADAAFFSTQWSKPISTGIGGIAYTSDESIGKQLDAVWQSYKEPSRIEQTIIHNQLLVYDTFFRPSLYWPLAKAYRFLTQKTGLMEGSSTSEELTTPERPSGFEKRMGRPQATRLLSALSNLDQHVQLRRAHAENYDRWVSDFGFGSATRTDYAKHSFLRYPVEVADKEGAIKRAKERRVKLGTWFTSPIDPIEKNLSQWAYQPGSCPVAESICDRIVNLPTDHLVNRDDVEYVLKGG